MEGGLRRKDTTKGPPLRILSLDGGGVRGYSMLIILQEIMHRTFVEIEGRAPKRNEVPKPCDHFDLIVGTGTGGLIALMLGRLRMSIETCKDVYVRMTKRVFETDKTIAGIPYRSTLFKASKLEDAIRDCVREHTIYESEGNDQGDGPDDDMGGSLSPNLPMKPGSAYSPGSRMERSASTASRYSQIGVSPTGVSPIQNFSGPYAAARWGKPNALLYDTRENRTKTAVTAMYKGSSKGTSPVLLRSYDSRREPAPEEKCTIWQAGRATAATALAFKPIQIGQSIFLDEGAGRYNPAPVALDEALLNEWPGREVGVLLSIGTGKRPAGTNTQQHLWWEGFASSSMGDFAEARRRLVAKIEGCEETHRFMLLKHLHDRNISPDHYYRLNVDVGVGEFGMNEWNRLSDISTNTRRYLSASNVQSLTHECARKLGAIFRANHRWNSTLRGLPPNRLSWELVPDDKQPSPFAVPGAIELPAEATTATMPPRSISSTLLSPTYLSNDDEKYVIISDDRIHPISVHSPNSWDPHSPRQSHGHYDSSPRPSSDHTHHSYMSAEGFAIGAPQQPPPLPPKTPLPLLASVPQMGRTSLSTVEPLTRLAGAPHTAPSGAVQLPYPESDGPPPTVNLARKPELR